MVCLLKWNVSPFTKYEKKSKPRKKCFQVSQEHIKKAETRHSTATYVVEENRTTVK